MKSPVPEQYNIEGLWKAIKNPSKFHDELIRVRRAVEKRAFLRKHGSGINPIYEDWDNLIILDACRYDIFRDINFIQGDVSYVVSKASHSKEFYEMNVSGRELYDIVYVTANPYGAVLCSDVFFRTETTFSGETEYDSRGRVAKTSTDDGRVLNFNHVENISPSDLTRKGLEMHREHPNKRLMIHFMQPHAPYLGEQAEVLRRSVREEYGVEFTAWTDMNEINHDRSLGSLENAAKEGYISKEELVSVYIENLKIVLSHVEEFVSRADGKTVVTADHGELLGERKAGHRFGHPEGLFVEELRKVPWLTVESGKRRNVTEDRPIGNDEFSRSNVTDQLELLGYR